MKKILYISQDSLPINSAASIRLEGILKELSKQYNIDVLSSTKNSIYLKTFIKKVSNKKNLLYRLFNEICLSLEIFIRILIYGKKYDLIIVSSPLFFVAFFVSLANKIIGVDYIVDIRDLYPEAYVGSNLLKEDSFIYKIFKKMEKFIYNNAKFIITVTDTLVKYISKITQKKVFLIRNGYDNDLFNSSKEKYKKFTIVFHGTMGKLQNIELLTELIRKFKNFEDIEFLIIGSGFKDYMIKNLAENIQNVKYLPFVKYNEISNIISKAHLGVSFRMDDEISKGSFPVKIYEYIGVCIPIISTPYSEAGSFLEQYELGWQFSNDDIEQIVELILKLKEDEIYYKSIIKNICNKKHMFTRNENSLKLLKLIKTL